MHYRLQSIPFDAVFCKHNCRLWKRFRTFKKDRKSKHNTNVYGNIAKLARKLPGRDVEINACGYAVLVQYKPRVVWPTFKATYVGKVACEGICGECECEATHSAQFALSPTYEWIRTWVVAPCVGVICLRVIHVIQVIHRIGACVACVKLIWVECVCLWVKWHILVTDLLNKQQHAISTMDERERYRQRLRFAYLNARLFANE